MCIGMMSGAVSLAVSMKNTYLPYIPNCGVGWYWHVDWHLQKKSQMYRAKNAQIDIFFKIWNILQKRFIF